MCIVCTFTWRVFELFKSSFLPAARRAQAQALLVVVLGALPQAPRVATATALVLAAASAAAHCCRLREQQWRLRKAILEIVILQGSLLFLCGTL